MHKNFLKNKYFLYHIHYLRTLRCAILLLLEVGIKKKSLSSHGAVKDLFVQVSAIKIYHCVIVAWIRFKDLLEHFQLSNLL